MRVIVAGSREITDYDIVRKAIEDSGFKPSLIVSGGARGVDRLGERYAAEHGIPVKKFPADWEKFGKAAGHIRNKQMAEHGDALVAVWLNESRGTKNMIMNATNCGLQLYVVTL